MNWKGVMPAITTCFNSDLSIDFHFMAEHCRWLLDNGCTGIVALGSLGEGATLMYDEKLAILRTCVKVVHGRGPVVAAISALSPIRTVSRSLPWFFPPEPIPPWECSPTLCRTPRSPTLRSLSPSAISPIRSSGAKPSPHFWPNVPATRSCSPIIRIM